MKLSTIILATAMIGMASAESYLLFDASSRTGKSFKAKAVSKSSKRVGRNKALSESKSSKVSKCFQIDDPYRGRFSVEFEDELIGGIEEGSFSLSQSMSLSMSASLSLSFTTPIGKSGKSGDRGWSAEGKAGKSGRGKSVNKHYSHNKWKFHMKLISGNFFSKHDLKLYSTRPSDALLPLLCAHSL